MDSKKARNLGFFFILCAAFLWAVESAAAKLAYGKDVNFLQVVAIRSVIVVIIAFAYLLITRKSFKVDRKELSALFYLALAGTVFADILYFYCLTKVPLVNALLIAHLQPIFVIIFTLLIFKEDKLTKFDYIGIGIMILAGLLVTAKSFSNISTLQIGSVYDYLIILSTIAWASLVVVMRKYLKSVDAGAIVFYRFLIAAVFTVLLAYFYSSLGITSIYQIVVGVSVAFGFIFYYEGLKRVKGPDASAMESTTVFFAALLGIVLLGEGLTIMQVVGIVLLFIGGYVLSVKAK